MGLIDGVNFEVPQTFYWGGEILNEGSGRRTNPRRLDFYTSTIDVGATKVPNGIGNPPIDTTYNQAANTVLLPDWAVPKNKKVYPHKITVAVLGNTPWVGGKYVAIVDNLGNPLAYLPTNCLRGNAKIVFGTESETIFPIYQTVASFVAATGVITLPATSLVSTKYSGNAVVTVVEGTGKGQSAIIASNTATTITPKGGKTAFPVALDATSVVAIAYWSATAGGASTVTVANQNGSATPLVANTLDQGFWTDLIDGTGAGQQRPVASNSTTVITNMAAWTTNPDNTSLVCISDKPSLHGALDLCCSQKWGAAQTGSGLYVAVDANFTQGSPLRVYVEGKFGPITY